MSSNQSYVHFGRSAADKIAAPQWRPLDRAVARWVMCHGGSALLAEVAGWASFADGQGDSALPLRGEDAGRHGMRRLAAEEVAALSVEGLLGTPETDAEHGIDTPFVLDQDHLYLRRNYRNEVAVGEHIRARRQRRYAAAAPGEDDLDELFHGDRSAASQAQREAIRQAVGRGLFVLGGGPGTGKTATVLRLLLALARAYAARHEGGAPVIHLCAPTGKAAQRLAQALRSGADALRAHPQRPLPTVWLPHLGSALDAHTGTVHRLLGARGAGDDFTWHADNPISADIVVLDEASMIDLALLRALLDALPAHAVLVLVGDADQLSSVGTGSVLLDIASAITRQGGDGLVRLQHSFRAQRALLPINEAARIGDSAALFGALNQAGDAAQWQPVASVVELRQQLIPWVRALRTTLHDAGAFAPVAGDDPAAALRVLAALRRQQVLCALREGDFGAYAVNDAIEESLRRSIPESADAIWYPGRAVMINHNDSGTGLFNGDVGICLRDDSGALQVWFEHTAAATTSPGDAGSRLLRFNPGSLPAHRGAFAMTIHKSQGSEYEQVAVLLPADADNPILSRQLLYTGISRAKARIQLWCTEPVLAAAMRRDAGRRGALARRIG